jgi:hypothetical protein
LLRRDWSERCDPRPRGHEEAAAGFERLEAAVAADPDAPVPSYPQPLLILTRL